MLIDRYASLTSIVAAVLGTFALVALAQDCWVCTSTCTSGESGPCSEGMTVCEDGASPAGPGQTGVTSLQPFWHSKTCKIYTGGQFFISGDCEPPFGYTPLPCPTGIEGQCCFWKKGFTGRIEVVTYPQVQIQRCNENTPPCEASD